MPDTAGPLKSLPLDALAQYPLPGMAFPDCLAFSPDDRWITYLFSPERSLNRRLFAYDPQNGDERQLASFQEEQVDEGEISIEEALRRERQRFRERGITGYAWAKQANRLLFPAQDKLYIQDSPTRRRA